MLAARILTAAVLLAGFLAALFWMERWQFAILVGVVVAIAAHEWTGLAHLKGVPAGIFILTCTLAYAALASAWIYAQAADWTFALGTVFWLFVVPVWLVRGLAKSARPLLVPVGLVVIVPAAAAMVALPPRMLLAVLGLTWVADTAAYFVGRAWGRHKLAPRISPGKTLEGAGGALVAVAIYAMICALWLPELRPHVKGAAWVLLLACAVLLAVMSILGDLFESAIKRQADAKDSGKLLPGHGGVLDRIDSATSTLPIAALLYQWMLLT